MPIYHPPVHWTVSTPYTRRARGYNGISKWAIVEFQQKMAAIAIQRAYRNWKCIRTNMARRIQTWWKRNPSSFVII